MAALQGACTVKTVAITGGTPQTIMQIVAPTNQRLRVLEYELSFDGTNSANTPALITVERQTGGTFTNTAVAPAKINDPTATGETLQASYKTAYSTGSITTTDTLRAVNVPVFGGTVIIPQTPGQEDLIPGGTILGIKIAAGANVNVTCTVRYEE